MAIPKLFVLTVMVTFLVLTATGETIIKLKSKKNEKRVRHIRFEEKGPQVLLFKTKHELYYVENILSINDSIIVASNSRGTFEIKSVDIIQIKKNITQAEYAGYVVAGGAALGLLIGIPATWIEDGKDEVGTQIIGSLAVGSLAIPLIVIGRSTSKYNIKKWKVISLSIR